MVPAERSALLPEERSATDSATLRGRNLALAVPAAAVLSMVAKEVPTPTALESKIA